MSFDRPSESDASADGVPGLSPTDARLAMLAAHLRVHRFSVELTSAGLRVHNPEAPGCCAENPVLSEMITCRPFERDGGHLWFFDSAKGPIVEAERITDAVVRIKGKLAPRDGEPTSGRLR